MAQQAISPGRTTRRRAFFGLFDADGWSWASFKAFIWFVLIIFLLGYLPDRAYYLTTASTIDLGILAVSPVNFCPPENRTLPCPAPPAGILPWEVSPSELALPAGRTDGTLAQAGTRMYYIGGSDGQTASDKVFVTTTIVGGNFGKWQDAQPLPAPRTNAAAAFLNGSIYVVGGTDDKDKPSDSVFVGASDPKTGDIGKWEPLKDAAGNDLKLPAPRTDAAVVALPDGLAVIGGSDGSAATTTVWKSTLDKGGKLQAWAPNASLPEARSDAVAVFQGSWVFVYSGTGPNGPTTTALRADVSKDPATTGQLVNWGTSQGASNLPVARTNAAGFGANSALYLVGGTDGKTPKGDVYWAIPDSGGVISEWKHLPQADLPSEGLAGTAATVNGGFAFLVGGTTANGVTTSSARSNLAPKPPFFQLGLAGATIPGLKIEGEIGQQLGWLAAAIVGGGNFTLLVIIGVAFANREKTLELIERLRARRRQRRT